MFTRYDAQCMIAVSSTMITPSAVSCISTCITTYHPSCGSVSYNRTSQLCQMSKYKDTESCHLSEVGETYINNDGQYMVNVALGLFIVLLGYNSMNIYYLI